MQSVWGGDKNRVVEVRAIRAKQIGEKTKNRKIELTGLAESLILQFVFGEGFFKLAVFLFFLLPVDLPC